METRLACCKWSVGLTTEVPDLESPRKASLSHTLPLQLQAFASLLYMEGASGNGVLTGGSQRASGTNLWSQDYPGEVKPKQQSTAYPGVTLRAGIDERYEFQMRSYKLVNGR